MERSKIPCTSRLRQPQTLLPLPKSSARVLQPLENKAHEDPIKQLPARRMLSRRSKSFSDLRPDLKATDFMLKRPGLTSGLAGKTPSLKSMVKSTSATNLCGNEVRKPLLKSSLKSIPETKSTINKQPSVAARSAVKRPAAGCSDEAAKAKVSKPAKIAPYDYKARYNSLHEKHTNLVQTFKETKQKLINVDKDLEDYSILKNDHKKLQDTYDLIFKEKIELESERSKLFEERDELKNKLENLTEAQNNLQEQHDTLKKENIQNLSSIRDLKEIREKLENQLEILQMQHENLRINQTTLQNDYSKLKDEHQSLSNMKNQLETDLLEAKDTIKSLQDELHFYKTSLQSHEELRRKMHNQIQDFKGTIRVFCRVRPNKPQERDKMLCNITYVDESTLEIKKTKESINCISGKSTDLKLEFIFDKVFPPEASQVEVFEELSQLVQSALDGYHVCVFAYGQTGSGKTYTMQGEDNNNYSGMIPRTVHLIFNLITDLQKIGWLYTVEASFLEIYNEIVRDLLDPNNGEHHEIHFNEGKGTTVTNLTITKVASAVELIQLMSTANRNRATATTNYNEHSSRSHAVTKLTLTGYNEEMGISYVGSLNLVDLAGSESAKNSCADRITETKNINKSLSTLGTVMFALHNKEKHIPYRNSRLTYLLQSCLGGNSKTLMFVNIAPFEECYSESVNALRFAAKVKEVKVGSKRNKMYLHRELSNVSK